MALLFGRLTQGFVDFEMELGRAQAGNATAAALIPEAGVAFRHSASTNATYLVVLGS